VFQEFGWPSRQALVNLRAQEQWAALLRRRLVPLAMLLISETIVIRPFLHKHAEHAEYHRSPELKKASREVQWLVYRQCQKKLEGSDLKLFKKDFSSTMRICLGN
jgi:hypothetical protein